MGRRTTPAVPRTNVRRDRPSLPPAGQGMRCRRDHHRIHQLHGAHAGSGHFVATNGNPRNGSALHSTNFRRRPRRHGNSRRNVGSCRRCHRPQFWVSSPQSDQHLRGGCTDGRTGPLGEHGGNHRGPGRCPRHRQNETGDRWSQSEQFHRDLRTARRRGGEKALHSRPNPQAAVRR